MDGLAAGRQILAAPEPPTLAVLTTYHLDEYVFAALQAVVSTAKDMSVLARAVLQGTAPDSTL